MALINRDNIYIHLLEKQYNLIDKTIQDALLDKEWREWSVPDVKYEQFRKYAIKLIRKVFKTNKTKGIEIFEWFYQKHGLLIRK